jgi:preprotein translocase subunit SecE
MGKEKNAAASALLLRELFQLRVYKRSQGRIARQVTWGAVFLVLLLIAFRMYERSSDPTMQYGVPVAIVVLGGWIAYRLVNMPTFADFLIAVEAEMNKVSWPSKGELWRALLVVLFSIAFLVVALYFFDAFWRFLLSLVGVI